MATEKFCAQGCSGCSHGKPMYRLERVPQKQERYKEIYNLFYRYNLTPFGMKADGSGDGYEIVAAFAIKSIQSRRSCPAGVTTEEKPDLKGPTETLIGGVSLTQHEGEFYFGGIALTEEARGKKLGAMLLKKTVDEVKKLGGSRVYVMTPVNPAFYQSDGFAWDPADNRRLVKEI